MLSDPTPPPPEGRPQSVQLTLRVAMIGAIAVVCFAILFFRLWVLQVLSSERYASAAAASQARTVRVQAPRGRVVDADGRVLVGNRPGDALTFDLTADPDVARACARQPPEQPAPEPEPTAAELRRELRGLKGAARRARRAEILARSEPRPVPKVWRGCARTNAALVTLARLSDTSIGRFEDRIHEAIQRAPFEPVTLVDDADRALLFYVKENGTRFRGVRIAKRTVRDYPAYDAGLGVGYAAQLWGSIGEVTREDLDDQDTYPGAAAGDVVGHSGIERAYDRWLRGRDGTLNVTVDAQGNPQGRATLVPAPVPGKDVRLTLDIRLQVAAEKALRKGIAIARERGGPDDGPMPDAARGALVVMDVKTGAIRAVASWPSFDPRRTVGKGADRYLTRLFADKRRAPMLNRAFDGIYPPGSTFKPVTALAAIGTSLTSPSEEIKCGPFLEVDGQRYKNFETDTNSFISLRTALSQSCDTYFYALGKRLYDATSRDGSFQPQAEWMRRLGFGEQTGVDVPDSAGVAPDAGYKKELFGNDAINNRWTSGDAVNASIGQGFVQVTPLQIAALYALIANGGTLVTPHLGDRIEEPGGDEVVRELRAKARRELDIDPFVLETIRSGLRGATHDVTGTATKAFAGFPVGVAGKTGTAQKPPLDDFAWFAGYAPIDDPQLVAVCVIEQGGFGGIGPARAVRDVFARAFQVKRDGSDPRRYREDGLVPVDFSQIVNGQQLGDPEAPAEETAG